jgi:CubicO group peptidase (beta-lactamase class C family)
MTKPVTGVAMMMLYEEGKWRLDDPVSRYIPELANLKVYAGENGDGTPKLEDARRPMTMRELMTHTGGLAYGLVGTNPVDRMYRDTRVLNSAVPLQQMIDGLSRLPLLAQPGTRWTYSIAVDVQGYLVQKLSGQPFDVFLRTRIFEPLGMTDTGFHVPQEKLARLALVHGEDASGKLTPPDDSRGDPGVMPAGPSGGAGLFSTAADYARFCEMLLGGGRLGNARLLAPRTVEMLRTNHVLAEPLKTMRPGVGWGMGVQVIMDAAAAGEPYSNGAFHWYGIGGTWFWIDPALDFAFIGMIQHDNLRTSTAVHGLSRNWVYQAIED